ncbi:RagB/SusD family nutrient uptake outer membrane protein [Flavobacterium sp. KACC 22761]|uniref:RagB/SusD family nutrient uptake outer membrane protein n=1 Tax=Flavobacterium sp. KACC 22761 TaxID=3092665 RepID=UPI002A75171E|nr:RagB/SusD family nutrient uptake outer membrane protein [Flavobacterium sp. KACC 22761]WPO78363.1 RagB/SusD family nutrient uptake outer membrane protein [Flavobacterium sp. KACC 22761]
MKKYIKNKILMLAPLAVASALMVSCSEDFLEPDPLSFYEPETTFSTESGLQAVLASADKQLRNNYIHYNSASNSVPIGTEYVFSDMAKYGKTDNSSTIADFANTMVPTMSYKTATNDDFYFGFYWTEAYTGIKHANTVLTYIDKVTSLTEDVKRKYIGQAYFHRAYRYLNLVYQFGDIPLITKILEVPKQSYYSTKKEAIIEMITADMEKAVEWVPDQAKLPYLGVVNKGACRQLLIKCYLASGRFKDAENQADLLINSSGYSLMQGSFGTFDPGGNPTTWTINRNVIWDLHRPENKIIAGNREAIMVLPNGGVQSFLPFASMRIFGPNWNSATVTTPDGKQAANRFASNNTANYQANYDYARALGRGIATISASYYSQHPMWVVNGIEDKKDLRHNSTVGNWVNMEDLKYSDRTSAYYGQNFRLKNGTTLLSKDTLREWFDFPLYKIYLHDVVNETNPNATDFQGASTGSKAHWYLYRLAETYLLRAEARFYQGNIGGATQDVNAVRTRAGASQLYNTVTIGDICAERGRELYLEEWRNVELKRISHCLALSGKPDEWGQTYNKTNWDKQSGTDNAGGSYWYQRIVHYTLYNKYPSGIVVPNGTKFYTMDKRNNYWPIPSSAITANIKGKLSQNYGYDGYDPNIKVWDKWQDAVADESQL